MFVYLIVSHVLTYNYAIFSKSIVSFSLIKLLSKLANCVYLYIDKTMLFYYYYTILKIHLFLFTLIKYI